ncbi:MAG: S8 family serine peptidase [Gammaproteobacteria bacterium]
MFLIRNLCHCLTLLLLCAGLAAGTVLGAEQSGPGQTEALFSGRAEDAEKIILVLHRGRPGSNMASGSRMNMYRSRGYSRDATWNQRVAREIASRHGLTYLTDWWMSEIDINCAVLQIQEGESADEVIADLLSDPEVVTAQRLGVFSTLSAPPNDPYFELQSSARYFDLPLMHSRTTGKGILIAVVDTGIEKDHPDLAGQIAFSENFVEDVSPGYSQDMHGTAVAGVIAAHVNNDTGIAGMAPGAKIAGLKACWPRAEGKLEAICNSFTLALAINRAMADEVDIINLSLSGPYDRIVEMLIEEALSKDIVVIAATKEDDSSASVSFPASMLGVIAVTSKGSDSWRQSDQPVFAPGTNVLTTLPNNSYNFVSGTSLGAAQIAGYAALLLQENPGLSGDDIHHRLIDVNNGNLGKEVKSYGSEVPDQFPSL